MTISLRTLAVEQVEQVGQVGASWSGGLVWMFAPGSLEEEVDV